MQTINNRMTETQIADLFSLAVQLQVKAEESDDRDTAILAYSIQNACSNLTESRREFRAADATIHNLELKLTDMAVQLANAESKCRELAAENAGLKAICEDRRTFIMNGVQLGYIKVPTVDTDPALDTIRVAVSPQESTPATDAFLAEVRAQGVDALAQTLDGLIAVSVTRSYITEFAAQLRKGVEL
ncbi:eae-like domain protein [Citrobacter portucalensis]|uniref:eae-like domain protein n=1 Tax=Citrobacter portucalensis TaxID=1639133 RepID=UPI001F444D1C|nr:eae-like domain protein [Citrobacter portucalensis]